MDVIDIALSKGIAQTEVKKLEGKILDDNGQIQSSLLPNYTEIPIEYETREDFPLFGETGYIYVDKSTGRRYKWSGSIYIEIVADLILGETEFSAYRGDRGKIAYDHSQTEGNPHNTTATQIGAVPKGRTINGKTLESDIEISASDVGALSDETTINGKLLSGNINLTAEDVGALSKDADIPSLENYATKEYVDKTVTDKNTELSNTINAQIKTVSDKVDSFDSALEDKIAATEVDEKLSQLESKIPTDYVPSSRTINGKVLETDISLNAQDIGAEQEGAAEQMLQNAKSYADEKDELISSQISQHQEEVGAKISSIEQDIVNQEEQISNINEAQTLINTTLNENKQKIQENSNKIQENLSAINTNSQKIGENTAEIEENSSQISQHKEQTNQKFSLIDQSLEAQGNEIDIIKGDLTSHTNSSNAQFSAVREEVATQDAETLKTAKEYSDANKESAVSSANEYTDQKIDELVNGTGLEGVVDTIKDINEAMAESSDMMEALETANSKKVDKGAKGSIIKPIYFDNNGAQEIAYTIEKSVPADAKFTDTTYTLIKDATNNKIQLMDGDTLVSEVDDNNTTYDLVTAEKAGLMSLNDKTKLDGIEAEANKTIIDSELSISSENPVQNRVINAALNNKLSFDEEVVNSENSAIKAVPKGSGKYAAVNKVGGMSYKTRNLLEVTATTQTVNGVTFTVNADKSITASGTATDRITYQVKSWGTYNTKGKYLKGCAAGGSWNTYCLVAEIYSSSSTYVGNRADIGGGTILDLDGGFYMVVIDIKSGTTVNTTFYPMIADSLSTEYEPYYSDIRNAAVTKITSTPNLINEALFANTSGGNYTEFVNGQIHLVNTTGTAYSSNKITLLLPKGNYYLNMKANAYTGGFIVAIVSDGITAKYLNGVNSNRLYFNVTTPITLTIALSTNNTNTVGDSYANLWLTPVENGEYKPYKENTLTIPSGARKTGYGLGINEDYYNYIDFERKVFVKNVAKIDLGTLNWVVGSGNSKEFVASSLKSVAMKPATDEINIVVDKYTAVNYTDYTGNYADKSCMLSASSGNFCLVDKDLTLDTVKTALSGVYLVYPLATPEEIDISEYLPDDNYLEVAAGGAITAINEYNYDAPTEISFFTSENSEKIIVADKIAGDLVGVAEEAQSLTGLDSTIEELNYLHKNIIEEEGWLIPESGEFELGYMPGATGPLGIVIGNSYTFTLTYNDGAVNTETITAIDASAFDSIFPPGTPAIQGSDYEGIMIVDKILSNENEEFVVGNNYYWNPPSYIDSNLASVKMTGEKADGTSFTHQAELYNKIPVGHLPDGIGETPVIQEWEWTNSDTGRASSGIEFQKPKEYNRCEIFIFDRKLKPSGSATVYGTLMFPACKEDGNDWDGYTYAGETPANAKLGMGAGDTTIGGTEWIITLKGECSFLEQGCIFTYHYGAEKTKTINISSAEGAPPTFIGQFSCVLNSDSDKTSILDSSLQWHFLAIPEQNQGNYIKVVWYKD